ARGRASAALSDVEADVVGLGARSRAHVVVRDADGAVRAWATLHDRAAGRVVAAVVVDPGLAPETADAVAHALFAWVEAGAVRFAAERGIDTTQVDSGAFADDPRQQRWLTDAGFRHTRTWWQMSRPVTPGDADVPQPGPGVTVRRVRRGEDGMPEEHDLVAVHDVLEEAFADHFNYHAETFDEFVARLREDPGHRWDHWWLAEITDDAGRRPAGALVGTVSPGGDGRPDGSYVSYLGVLRSARGRGVATSLLDAVVADAARRGRDRVGLEVDADSPTGAASLYSSRGFVTSYVTRSWHRDVAAAPAAPGHAAREG
ncbi:GNAT family N-acetyltransferase, partial [Actinotalea sp. JY-7885]